MRQSLTFGVLLGIVSAFLLVTMDSTAKWINLTVPIYVTVWMRFLIPQIAMGAIMTARDGIQVWSSKAPWLQAVRSLSLVAATFCLFIAITHLSLTTNVAIFYLGPFFVALTAMPVLGEYLNRAQWISLAVGLLGVMIAVGPWAIASDVSWPLIFAFGAAASTALYQLFTRLVARYDKTATSQVYTTTAGAVIFAPLAMWFWPQEIGQPHLFALLTFGLLGGLAHWLMIYALTFTPAPIIAPLFYTNIFWIILFDILIFGLWPTPLTIVGCGVVILAGLYFLRAASDQRKAV